MTTRRTVSPALQHLARFGYVAKGIVYLIVGFLAARSAVAGRGKPTDEQGALITILRQPFGRILLGIVAAGLLCYALWRFVELIFDPKGKGEESRWLARFQYAISALVYTGLGLEAVRMVTGLGSRAEGGEKEAEQAGILMSLPFGHWLTMVVAAVAIAFGLFEIYKAVAREFEDKWELKGLSKRSKPWVLRVGRVGIFSRGVVGTVVGTYFLLAGLRRSPSQARGTRGAIESLSEQPYGHWLLVLIALGLFAYGIYTLFEARFRKLES